MSSWVSVIIVTLTGGNHLLSSPFLHTSNTWLNQCAHTYPVHTYKQWLSVAEGFCLSSTSVDVSCSLKVNVFMCVCPSTGNHVVCDFWKENKTLMLRVMDNINVRPQVCVTVVTDGDWGSLWPCGTIAVNMSWFSHNRSQSSLSVSSLHKHMLTETSCHTHGCEMSPGKAHLTGKSGTECHPWHSVKLI